MKKILSIALLLAVMAGAMAQNQGAREYVSALVTFADTNLIPQDSLNKYGVVLQTRSGRMATALIDASKYQSFLNAGLVERVQPSTRVFLRDEQINAMPEQKECCKEHAGKNVRQNLIPKEDILNDEAKGWYLGMLVGGSSNHIDVQSARWSGYWYTGRGVNLEARVGYQFNQVFGIRSGLSLLSKNYYTNLLVSYNDYKDYYSTNHTNLYLQLPLMADLSIGGEDVRLNFMFGGYCAYWASQWRQGYVYVADDPRPYTGNAYSFVDGSDNRFEAGLAGGIGLSMRVSSHWMLRFEADYYHGLISTAKDFDTYNRTWTFGMGVTYHF